MVTVWTLSHESESGYGMGVVEVALDLATLKASAQARHDRDNSRHTWRLAWEKSEDGYDCTAETGTGEWYRLERWDVD